MIQLKEEGYTYGSSYGDTIFWKLDNKGKGIAVDRLNNSIDLYYDIPENTYRQITAKYITKTEFLKQYRKMKKVMQEQIKL